MKLSKIIEILDAELLSGSSYLNREIKEADGSDLLSDVLAFTHAETLLLTGLINKQVIITAEIADVSAICFVHGKRPELSVVTLSEKKKIPLILTQRRMYEACGLLYSKGLAHTDDA